MHEANGKNLPADTAHKSPSLRLLEHLFVPPRVECDELLDLGLGTKNEVKQNFADMWRINRYLGGLHPLTNHLFPRLAHPTERVTLVDVGTGSAQIPVQIARWASSHQRHVTVFALDMAGYHLDIAREFINSTPDIRLIQADALRLPFKDLSVDYFICSLFLHHLSPSQVVSFLSQTFAKVRKALIFSDLERGWLPLLAFKCLQPIFARSYLTRHDGAVSIRRAYTSYELLGLARQAGLTHARVFRHFPWRMTLIADKQS